MYAPNFLSDSGILTDNLISDFSRDDYHGPPITKLVDIIDYVKPTALLGLSTVRVCDACPFFFPRFYSFSKGGFHCRGHKVYGSHQPPTYHLPTFQPCQTRRVHIRRRCRAYSRNGSVRFWLAFPQLCLRRKSLLPRTRK